MAEPTPTEVAPWYLRNITQALALDTASGNVYVRTDAQLDIGNANITVGNVGINSLGNVDISGNTLPVSGNITIDAVTGNVNVTQGTDPWIVSGNVNANITNANIEVTQGTNPWVVTGNVIAYPPQEVTNYFGTPLVTELTPTIQINSYEGIKARETQTYTGGGGAVTENDTDIVLSSTSTLGSYAVYRSQRFIPYRSGQSGVVRVLAKFGTPALGASQRIGIANQESGYFVGFNGANDAAGNYDDIKFLHTAGGRAEVWSLTVTGTADNDQTVTVTLNNTVYVVNVLEDDTAKTIATKVADAVNDSAWLATAVDNTVSLLAGSLGNLTGTFSAVSSGNVTYALTEQVSGIAATDEWTGISLPAGIDPEEYNTWQIRYSWDGAEVYVLDPSINQLTKIIFHGVDGSGTLPIRKPSFKVTTVCYNVGGSTAVDLNVAYMYGALEGVVEITKYTDGGAVTKSSLASNTYHHIMSIQNPFTQSNYLLNFRSIRFLNLTSAVQANDPVELYVVFNAPLIGGTFDWTSVDERLYQQSLAEGTMDLSTNTPIAAFVAGVTGAGASYPLEEYNIVLPPGYHMSLVAHSTSALQKISISGTWLAQS